MKYLLLIPVLALLVQSCGNTRNMKVEDIDYLVLDYNPDAPNNYGTVIQGGVCAQMKSGELKCLKNNADFEGSNYVSFDIRKQEISLLTMPTAYDNGAIPVMLKMTGKKDVEVVSYDTLRINFNSGIRIGSKNYSGNSGANGRNGGQSTLFRDGKDGDNGLNGDNGRSGDSYDIHIWKDSNTYFIHVVNLVTGSTGKYKINGLKPFEINASGSNGGNGGRGGDGGDGKPGEVVNNKTKLPGNGGNGGWGGNGGNGGNGGTIRCSLHPSAADFRGQLQFLVQPGMGGNNGTAGTGGKAGTSLAGQSLARAGYNGRSGQNGFSGQAGQINIVEEAFDIPTYQ